MDEKQLNYEFMSILGESHPGLTFEEYRDSCVFLLFYHYLCLRYEEVLEEKYKLNAMVRMAIRGKLQMPSFLRFIEEASPFIHLANKQVQLTDFSFYKNLMTVQQLEKQKSYARFFRKLIKKMDSWGDRELLLKEYPPLFEKLMKEFARSKKETYISEDLLQLYHLFYANSDTASERIFLPDFEYGLLFFSMAEDWQKTQIYGYEDYEGYREIVRILCFMKQVPENFVHLYPKKVWDTQLEETEQFDKIGIFMPEGVEQGTFISDIRKKDPITAALYSISKGELPFLLSALPFLKEDGILAAILPSALLYREGKESQLRKYIVEQLNCLDVVMLLPDHAFQSTGQKEVFLLFQKKRKQSNVMFFDCSEIETFEKEQLHTIELAWRERKTIPGFCSCVERQDIEKNDYNLNLPRYIVRSVKTANVDVAAQKKRIEEINQELREIDHQMAMYKRVLEL